MFVDLLIDRQDRAPGQLLPRKILGIKPGLFLKKYNIHTVLVNQDSQVSLYTDGIISLPQACFMK